MYVDGLPQSGHRLCVSHKHVHKRVSTAEETNQVEKVTHSECQSGFSPRLCSVGT